jgi:hypothetical protein
MPAVSSFQFMVAASTYHVRGLLLASKQLPDAKCPREEMYSIPQYAFLYSALLGSMVAGASIMHAVLKPDLSLPTVAGPTIGTGPVSSAAGTGEDAGAGTSGFAAPGSISPAAGIVSNNGGKQLR